MFPRISINYSKESLLKSVNYRIYDVASQLDNLCDYANDINAFSIPFEDFVLEIEDNILLLRHVQIKIKRLKKKSKIDQRKKLFEMMSEYYNKIMKQIKHLEKIMSGEP